MFRAADDNMDTIGFGCKVDFELSQTGRNLSILLDWYVADDHRVVYFFIFCVLF